MMNWIDPDCLSPVQGVLDRFLPALAGIDALLLMDGTEVSVPPQMAAAVAQAVKPGERLQVRGLKAKGASVLLLVALDAADGSQIIDPGPAEPKEARKEQRKAARAGGHPTAVDGTIKQLLHNPRGELRGLLLETGATILVSRKRASEQAGSLQVGASIAVSGSTFDSQHGVLILARRIGEPGSLAAGSPRQRGGRSGEGKPRRKAAGDDPAKDEARLARLAARKAARQATKVSDRAVARQSRQTERKAERKAKRQAEKANLAMDSG